MIADLVVFCFGKPERRPLPSASVEAVDDNGQPAAGRPDRVIDELKVDMSSCRRTKPIDRQGCSLRFCLKVPQLAGPVKKPKNGWKTIRFLGSCHHIIAGAFPFRPGSPRRRVSPFKKACLKRVNRQWSIFSIRSIEPMKPLRSGFIVELLLTVCPGYEPEDDIKRTGKVLREFEE
jgi:hypothetical protein